MRATAPDGTVYDIARNWAGTELGRIVARWWVRMKRAVRWRNAGRVLERVSDIPIGDDLVSTIGLIVTLVVGITVLALGIPLAAVLTGLIGEFAWLLLLLPLSFLWRIIARKPWTLEVREQGASSSLARHDVVGFFAAGRIEREAAALISTGTAPDQIFRYAQH